MAKVVKKKKKETDCGHCGSTVEYYFGDIHEHHEYPDKLKYDNEPNIVYYVRCPLCMSKIDVPNCKFA